MRSILRGQVIRAEDDREEPVMTLIPKTPLNNLLRRRKPQTEDERDQALAHKEASKNEYFTFDKDGQLIDVNDEEVLALEREIEDNWREAFLASVQEADDSELRN